MPLHSTPSRRIGNAPRRAARPTPAAAKPPAEPLAASEADGREAGPVGVEIGDVVAALKLSRETTHNIRPAGELRRPPSRKALAHILDLLVAALFPTHYGAPSDDGRGVDAFVADNLRRALDGLAEQVERGLTFSGDGRGAKAVRSSAEEVAHRLVRELPAIRGMLVDDLRAALRGDPAATGYPEILIGYPGMIAIIHHRIAHRLHRLGAHLIARIVADIARSRTGIDIHPAAQIGASFFIDHGTGVVIGETAIVGERVRIYQAVTLGARRFETDEAGGLVKGVPRHPIIEDDVVIYAGATILGRVVIGRGATIGGNVWISQDVAPGSTITQARPHSR